MIGLAQRTPARVTANATTLLGMVGCAMPSHREFQITLPPSLYCVHTVTASIRNLLNVAPHDRLHAAQPRSFLDALTEYPTFSVTSPQLDENEVSTRMQFAIRRRCCVPTAQTQSCRLPHFARRSTFSGSNATASATVVATCASF